MSKTRGAVDRVDTRPQDFSVEEREVIAALRTEAAALKEALDEFRAWASCRDGTPKTGQRVPDRYPALNPAGVRFIRDTLAAADKP